LTVAAILIVSVALAVGNATRRRAALTGSLSLGLLHAAWRSFGPFGAPNRARGRCAGLASLNRRKFVLLPLPLPHLLVDQATLIAAGAALMIVWKHRCRETTCAVLKELSIALSSVILPLLGWLSVIQALAACINHVVAGVLSTVAAVIGVAVLHCIGP
jgi:hypothetical protein